MAIKHIIYIPAIIFASTLFSCDRIKDKGEELANNNKGRLPGETRTSKALGQA